jgi:hypothetical protein
VIDDEAVLVPDAVKNQVHLNRDGAFSRAESRRNALRGKAARRHATAPNAAHRSP